MATINNATSKAGIFTETGHGVTLDMFSNDVCGQHVHRMIPASGVQQLRFWQRNLVKPWYEVKQFIYSWLCCSDVDYVGDWEFDILARKEIHARLNDDIEFTDVAKLATASYNVDRIKTSMYERVVQDCRLSGNDPFLPHRITEAVGAQAYCNAQNPPQFFDTLRAVEWDEFKRDNISRKMTEREWDCLFANAHFSADGRTVFPTPTPKVTKDVEEEMANLRVNELRVSAGANSTRRRKRVIAHCVVALINRVRAKYYQLDDSKANRRMIASYLLKLMREYNFRTSDIHLHVHYAVDIYFESLGSSVAAAARA